MKVLAVIPARYSSTRFAGKVLARDTGKYLIQHTYERACLAKCPEKVLIAADDPKVVDAARAFGGAQFLKNQADALDGDSDTWAIGFDHNFSKRTRAYALYTEVNSDQENVVAGSDWSGFSLGMIHSF